MSSFLAGLLLVSLGQADKIETRLLQVQPAVAEEVPWTRTKGQAVILIHGLHFQTIAGSKNPIAHFHDWQKTDSYLVRALAKEHDVYSFAYGQNAGLPELIKLPVIETHIKKLKFMGYREIVLVGHSAGGLLARHFVEDNPNAGVSRVVQVCSPNAGSTLAKASFVLKAEQKVFLTSLTKDVRQKWLLDRGEVKIPPHVSFLSIVGATVPSVGTPGDGVVTCASQWPSDLQSQGIPAAHLPTTHFTVMRSKKTAERVAELIHDNHPRWRPEQVSEFRKTILKSD